MRFRQWLGKKIMGKPISNGSLSDIDRDNALNARRLNAAMKQQEKTLEILERVAKMEAKVNPRSNPMDALVEQALPILLQKMTAEQAGPGMSPPQPQEVSYTDQQIAELLKQNPKLKKHAAKFTDEGIKEYLMQQDPNLSADTINRIIMQVRS